MEGVAEEEEGDDIDGDRDGVSNFIPLFVGNLAVSLSCSE